MVNGNWSALSEFSTNAWPSSRRCGTKRLSSYGGASSSLRFFFFSLIFCFLPIWVVIKV